MKLSLVGTSMVFSALVALTLAGPAGAHRSNRHHVHHGSHSTKQAKAPHAHGGIKLSATLTGPVENPRGDPDGTGKFTARLNPGHSQLCYTLTSARIGAPTAAHIHAGRAGETGAPVLPLQAQAATETCVAVDKAVADKILADPAGYYVNVHNAEFPGGAVRGQLTKG